jgi:predicted TIM-barrel fold metal-dependent hydrolase
MAITDAQVHIWDPETPERPWPRPLRTTPQKPNGFTAAEMIAEMDAAGVDRTVIVPTALVGERNDEAFAAVAKYPGRFAIMGRFDINQPNMKEAVATWKQQPGMLGMRHTFIEPFRAWLHEGRYEPFWAAAEEHNIPLMCLVLGTPEELAPVAQRHPGLTLIVDHFGAHLNKKGAEAFAMIDQLVALAKFPNVSVKVSSAPSISADPYPFRDIYPFIKQVYEAFGPQRMMWGSDFTRLTSTYPECLAHFREGLDFLTEDDKRWILGKALAEKLSWPE